jgi:hypothetical protein
MYLLVTLQNFWVCRPLELPRIFLFHVGHGRNTSSEIHIHWHYLHATIGYGWFANKYVKKHPLSSLYLTHTHRYWQIPTGSMRNTDEEPCSERPVDFSSLHWLTTRQYPTTLLCRTYTWDCSFMFFQHLRLEGQPAHRPTKHLSTKTSEWWKAENRQRCLALPRVYSVGVSIDVLPPSSRSTRRGDSFWWRTMDVRML